MRRFDPRQLPEQFRQTVAQPEVVSIRGGVLADEVDFADTLCEECASLGQDALRAAAAEAAAELRDDAEAAGMVAALVDLDVGVMARRRQQARRQVMVEIRCGAVGLRFSAFAQIGDAFHLVGANDGVDFRDLLADFAAVALHQAAGDDELTGAAGLLELGHFEDRVH